MRALSFLLLTACLLGGTREVHAQPGMRADAGPFVAVDVSGAPFIIGIEGKAVGVTAGYQFGQALGLALRVERAPKDSDGNGYVYLAGRTLLGVDASVAVGPARAPLRFALVAGAAIEDQSHRLTFLEGRTDFRDGARLYQFNATASATKYIPLRSGSTRISAGIGPFVEVRHILPRTTTFNVGSEFEREKDSDAVTDWPFGILVAVPVAVRLTDNIDLAIEASMRFDVFTSILGGVVPPHVSVGLDF